jgi:hypothetical protein
MEADQRSRPTPSSRRGTLAIGALAAIALGVAAFFIVRALVDNDNDGGALKSQSAGFTLRYPAGWKPVSKGELARLPNRPLAVVRRTDKKGILILNRHAHTAGNLNQVARQLDRQLKRRIPDFRKVSEQRVNIKAGSALFYSYIRKRKGTVHTVAVVPVGANDYTLNGVVAAGAKSVARDVGSMIRSFDVNR